MLDLADIPIVDNHCHALFGEADGGNVDAARLRGWFAEDAALGADPQHTATTVHYRWTVRQLAGQLGCASDEAAVVAALAGRSLEERDALWLGSAGLDWVLVDRGFPPPAAVRSMDEIGARVGVRVGRMERVEQIAEGLIAQTETLDAFRAALAAELEAIAAGGVVAFKSVVAYRTGLDVEEPEPAALAAAFAAVRAAERPRLTAKPLADHVVLETMRTAERHGLPVQFHTGYGDADVDLERADPFLLRPLLQRFPQVPVVMLHGSYPYTRHAAVLAATYPNAYADISFVVPFVHGPELVEIVRQALASAPISRVMYSSDAFGSPEHYWLGAVRGRAAIARALDELVFAEQLAPAEARDAGAAILGGNARRLYRLAA